MCSEAVVVVVVLASEDALLPNSSSSATTATAIRGRMYILMNVCIANTLDLSPTLSEGGNGICMYFYPALVILYGENNDIDTIGIQRSKNKNENPDDALNAQPTRRPPLSSFLIAARHFPHGLWGRVLIFFS